MTDWLSGGSAAEEESRALREPGSHDAGTLHLELDGWGGQLDLLLELARRQKVDLRQISILSLADQYLEYISEAEVLELELAADYLVMAAWLAFLKSTLLLPEEEQEEPGPEELALRLQLRLQRLDAMREAGARLVARDRAGRDVFMAGAPEGLATDRRVRWRCRTIDLLRAYGQIELRNRPAIHMVRQRSVMTLETALDRLSAMLRISSKWLKLNDIMPEDADPGLRRSVLASSFVAALELARKGHAEIAQDKAFAPLHLRGVPA